MTSGSQEPTAEIPPPWEASDAEPVAVLVAGVAGSGKTTLGRALAARTGAVPLDLDSLTNPLLDALGDALPGPHWLAGPHADRVRAGRYAALRTAARDVLGAGRSVVLIAPFTTELRGGAEWRELVAALVPHPVRVVQLVGDPEVLAARRTGRGEVRDEFRPGDVPVTAGVPHLSLDIALSPAQQQFRALRHLGFRQPVDPSHPLFGRTFDAVLFDFDGTLADSTPAVLRSWARLAAEFGFPAAAVQENHGMPARALLATFLAADEVEVAVRRVEEFETADVGDVTALPGVLDLLAALPADRVAVVTSATRAVVGARLLAAGVDPPKVLVSLDDVRNPKPDPEPFLSASAQLGVDPSRCLVVEDARSGVLAARRAGCAVLAVGGTSDPADLAEADLVLDSLERLRVLPGERAVRFALAGN